MYLSRPGVIKQHKPKPFLATSLHVHVQIEQIETTCFPVSDGLARFDIERDSSIGRYTQSFITSISNHAIQFRLQSCGGAALALMPDAGLAKGGPMWEVIFGAENNSVTTIK